MWFPFWFQINMVNSVSKHLPFSKCGLLFSLYAKKHACNIRIDWSLTWKLTEHNRTMLSTSKSKCIYWICDGTIIVSPEVSSLYKCKHNRQFQPLSHRNAQAKTFSKSIAHNITASKKSKYDFLSIPIKWNSSVSGVWHTMYAHI